MNKQLRVAPGLERLSLNTASTKNWTLAEAVAGCVNEGIGAIGLWRDRVAEAGLATAAKLVRDAGLTVTSLCRGGFFTTRDWEEDNRCAVDEAAALGADTLVLVCGGLPAGDRGLSAARAVVADRIARLAPYAEANGVRLAIEPLHPMFCADRAVVSTLGQAIDLAEAAGHGTGVVVDTYHVWWDPALEREISRAGRSGLIRAFQVCDWLLPIPPDALLGRGHVGDGYIDIPHIVRQVDAAGYNGWIEVEIFNQDVWDTPGERTLRTIAERHRLHLAGIGH